MQLQIVEGLNKYLVYLKNVFSLIIKRIYLVIQNKTEINKQINQQIELNDWCNIIILILLNLLSCLLIIKIQKYGIQFQEELRYYKLYKVIMIQFSIQYIGKRQTLLFQGVMIKYQFFGDKLISIIGFIQNLMNNIQMLYQT
ncbi:unnamed protein product [Paramecium pentaurelia]|uniref:Transmembrane protein n=1 Tax=Paramecium pentaurelia TaxID=43138 RepID=A0A8S1Y0Z1_9CILI|nr:unnamed protein product [Paramecium pentaurelia]